MSRPSILIVDDEPAIAKMLSTAFARSGYEVRIASNGLEAVSIGAAEKFDVLLTDVRMPGMNGHELVRHWVVRQPETVRVLMSGYDDTRCEGCGHARTRCAMLRKPFAPKGVVEAVDALVRDSSLNPS